MLFLLHFRTIGTILRWNRRVRNSSEARVVAACKIQQGESRQVCNGVACIGSGRRHKRSPRPSPPFFLADYYSLFRYFVPSHHFDHNLFRHHPFRTPLLAVLIPSISHYPANSLPTRPSQKSSCPPASLSRRVAIDIRFFHCSSRILFEPSGRFPVFCRPLFFHFRSDYIKRFLRDLLFPLRVIFHFAAEAFAPRR